MIKLPKTYWIIGILLFTIYVIAQLNKPQKIDWSVTLAKKDKIPFGAFVAFDQLKQMYSTADIKQYSEPLYNKIHNNYSSFGAYIIISSDIKFDKLDWETALDYVSEGNTLFLAAENFSKNILDTLGLKLDDKYLSIGDTTGVLIGNINKSAHVYQSKNVDVVTQSFQSIDTTNIIDTIGYTTKHKPNFIKVFYGDGAIYIHTNPLVFSNFFLLEPKNYQYTQAVFQAFAANYKEVVWDEYYKPGNRVHATPLRFFLSNAYLKWALWLLLLGGGLMLVLTMKRKQRMIPVQLPLINSSVEFVKTVAQVYFHQKDNHSIVQKKWQHWLEYIKEKYYISVGPFSDSFVLKVAQKSGTDEQQIQEIITIYTSMQQQQPTDEALLKWAQKLDAFYQNTY